MAKISIIVPVYNVEKYLTKCLQSLVNQTFRDIEIICVNDGSTDNSLAVLNDFACSDSRVKVITQDNSGVSSARNRGITESTAQYLMFLDGDDYYTPHACELAYEKIEATGADVGVFGITELYGFIMLSCIVNKNIKKVCKKAVEPDLWKFQTYSVNKIYKKSFLFEQNLKFPVGVKTAEDLIFSLSCLFKNPKYCFIDKPLYVYRKNRKNSVTTGDSGVKNDLDALKLFYQSEVFQQQAEEIQLKVIEKFCSGSWNYYKRNRRNKELLVDIKRLIEFIEQRYEVEKLVQFKKYNQIKAITRDI